MGKDESSPGLQGGKGARYDLRSAGLHGGATAGAAQLCPPVIVESLQTVPVITVTKVGISLYQNVEGGKSSENYCTDFFGIILVQFMPHCQTVLKVTENCVLHNNRRVTLGNREYDILSVTSECTKQFKEGDRRLKYTFIFNTD